MTLEKAAELAARDVEHTSDGDRCPVNALSQLLTSTLQMLQ